MTGSILLDQSMNTTAQAQPLPLDTQGQTTTSASASRPPRRRPNRTQAATSSETGHGRRAQLSTEVQNDATSTTVPAVNTTASRPPRRQRGPRNANENGVLAQRNAPRVQTGSNLSRPFGGSLTTNVTEHSPTSSALNADALNFVPRSIQPPSESGQSRATQTKVPRRRRASRSSAPDVTTRIHEDINNRQYECPICTSEVLRNSKIWSCHTCWTVFHLSCIKTWSSNTGSSQAQHNGDDQAQGPKLWRCPGCNLPQETKPSVYTCWCGKEHDPRAIAGLPPHSCGQTCGKSRLSPKKCPHPCELLCHAGPCPPCTSMGPKSICFCGKESSTRRCVDTNYESGWSCGKPCGDLMPCGEHTCERPCHEGLCGACEVSLDARCYCGKEKKEIFCCDKDDELPSSRISLSEEGTETTETWTGRFNCTRPCERPFDCGKHRCQKECHAQTSQPTHCPRSPDMVSHCACGKTQLSDISSTARISCEDLIPNCTKTCDKLLVCGHTCPQLCHTGPCLPCLRKVDISCRCGRTTSQTICHQGQRDPPQCMRICRTTLNCGRHDCGEHCCPGERRAIERQATKRKLRPLDAARARFDDGFEAEHICTRVCGRLLKCGSHYCQELCHKGPCNSCREAIFDELACNCGRTVLQPPLPCGTKPPACRFECERPTTCGHPRVPHNCHGDDESCPKCPFHTEKQCACGKKILKNQQCWFTDVRCGEICGKRLKCGYHFCRKLCHKPGACEDADQPCTQPCGKEKTACGHACEIPCHKPYPCREDKPCPHKILVTCECQHNKQEQICKATKSSPGNQNKVLPCDDECARLERNRKLAMALDIDPATRKDDFVPYSNETLGLYQENVNWSQAQEREFRVFADSEDEKRLRFKPMPAQQRSFLHYLAEDFGFDSESLDPEPHRHVLIFKAPKFVSAPTKTIRDCLRIRQSQKMATATEVRVPPAKIAAPAAPRYPYNGFLLSDPRFGLTVDELSTEIASLHGFSAHLQFQITFLPTGEVSLLGKQESQRERSLEQLLKDLKPSLSRAFSAKSFGSLQLCSFDSTLSVIRKENDGASTGGWSQVAAKGAAPRLAPQVVPVGAKSSFTILGSLNKAKKKAVNDAQRVKLEPVVDDWEAAAAEDDSIIAEAAPIAEDGRPTTHVATSAKDESVPTETGPAAEDCHATAEASSVAEIAPTPETTPIAGSIPDPETITDAGDTITPEVDTTGTDKHSEQPVSTL